MDAVGGDRSEVQSEKTEKMIPYAVISRKDGSRFRVKWPLLKDFELWQKDPTHNAGNPHFLVEQADRLDRELELDKLKKQILEAAVDVKDP